MSFISFAQNFEDVMFWRTIKHVQNGFYIDAGGGQRFIVDDATNSKINELNLPACYGRAISVRLDQSTYIKKFWRITWSLSRLMRTTRIMEWGYLHA
jgi:hypothetical protein